MIAHIRPPKRASRTPEMCRARQMVAEALLRKSSRSTDEAPPLRAWKAWLVTAWVVAVTGAYAASMLGLL